EVRKTSRGPRPFPSADTLFEPYDRLDRHVEVLLLRPARRTDDEPHDDTADSESCEQRLTEPLAFGALDRRKDRARPVVQHTRASNAEPALEEGGQGTRDTQVAFD